MLSRDPRVHDICQGEDGYHWDRCEQLQLFAVLIHSTPTAREIRRTMIVSEIKICVIVRSFAQ